MEKITAIEFKVKYRGNFYIGDNVIIDGNGRITLKAKDSGKIYTEPNKCEIEIKINGIEREILNTKQ